MKLGTFKVDCTPPSGSKIIFGEKDKTVKVRDPLFLRGIIIEDKNLRLVIVSLDFCGLMNRAYDELTNTIAKGAGTSPENVTVHCIHQHDTPLVNFEMEKLLKMKIFPKNWWKEVLSECRSAATKCLKKMTLISSVGHAETRLHGYASNRRIIGRNGKVMGMRYSRCSDLKLKEKPVGTIDPFLRTIAFKNSKGKVVSSMSFYATHPQVSNGRNTFSADAPGEGMRLVEKKFPDSFPCFLTGPGGNVTAGKYSSLNDLEGNLLKFGKILAEGINHNLKAMRWEKQPAFSYKHLTFEFPRKKMAPQKVQTIIDNPKTSLGLKRQEAFLLSSYGYKKNKNYWLKLIKIGDTKIMFMPGEPFVEYQLYTQSLVPDEFIAVAANCSDNFLYLPLENNFDEGGYEVTSFRWCTKAIEKKLKTAIKELVNIQ